MTCEIAVIPGDGIGPEVTAAVQPLFRDVALACDFDFVTEIYDWGTERYLETGVMMLDDALIRSVVSHFRDSPDRPANHR